MRKVTVKGKDYFYRIGFSNATIKLPDSDKRVVVRLDDLKDTATGTVARGRWKKSGDGMVQPSDVSRYILKNLR